MAGVFNWAWYIGRRHLFPLRRIVIAAGVLLSIWAGVLSADRLWEGDLFAWLCVSVLVGSVLGSAWREAGIPTRSEGRERFEQSELGALLLVSAYVVVALSGGPDSFLYPFVYALVSFLFVVHQGWWMASIWGAVAISLELFIALTFATPWTQAATHILFVVFFALGNLLLLSRFAFRMRKERDGSIRTELKRIRQEAVDFRLIASQLPAASRAERSRDEEELRMEQGAVHAVHEQLFFTIDLLCTSLSLHTAALLWVREESGDTKDSRKTPSLVIKEMATSSDYGRENPELDSAGILAAVLKSQKPLRLKALKGRRTPPYYSAPEKVSDICAVPILEGAALRGILCVDRISDQPFSDEEEQILEKAGEQILRVIAQERSFAGVERSKYEQEKFYAASELLNQALTLDDVYQKTFAAIAAIAPYDLIALTRYDAHSKRHDVLAVRLGEEATSDEKWQHFSARLKEHQFEDGNDLISMATKNRHHMPANGELGDAPAAIFGRDLSEKRARSALILPLTRGEQVMGNLVMVSTREKAYPVHIREMLRVIGHQVGVSMQNARMYQSMEERATTDGLTGLTNHRSFQERLERLHALAERSDQKFSIILTDIDHFKSVNDTYGHPVGDLVLKRVAAIFAKQARKVDIVARYGGEEFVLVLPGTSGDGAAQFANRLREEIAAQTIKSENGSFNVTLSMGVAEYPRDGSERYQLIERADQALYYCKEHGRNRVTQVCELPSAITASGG